jgi:hypothetical protein
VHNDITISQSSRENSLKLLSYAHTSSHKNLVLHVTFRVNDKYFAKLWNSSTLAAITQKVYVNMCPKWLHFGAAILNFRMSQDNSLPSILFVLIVYKCTVSSHAKTVMNQCVQHHEEALLSVLHFINGLF